MRMCFLWPLRLMVLQAGSCQAVYQWLHRILYPHADLQSANPAYQGFSNPLVGSSYEHPVEQRISSRELAEFMKSVYGLVAVFQSLSFHSNRYSFEPSCWQAQPNMKRAWSMHTVRHNWQLPSLLVFNSWLKEKEEGHKRLRALGFRAKTKKQWKRKQRKSLHQTLRTLAITKASLTVRHACCEKESMPFDLAGRSSTRMPISDRNL